MAVEFRALRPSFAAEVDGIDLSQPMDADSVRTIWDAIDRYAVLVFSDQRLTDTQLRDFALEFGPLEIGRAALQGGKRRLALPQIGDISNLDEENRIRARDDRRRLDSLGNRLWHNRCVVHAGAGRAWHAARRRGASGIGAGWRGDRIRRHACRL